MISETALRSLLVDVYEDLILHEKYISSLRAEFYAVGQALLEIGDQRFRPLVERHKQDYLSRIGVAAGDAKLKLYEVIIAKLKSEEDIVDL